LQVDVLESEENPLPEHHEEFSVTAAASTFGVAARQRRGRAASDTIGTSLREESKERLRLSHAL
jgi:hypothetical protein